MAADDAIASEPARHADRAIADLRDIRERLLRRVREILARLDTASGSSALNRDAAALRTSATVLAEVNAALRSMGEQLVVDAMERRAAEVAVRVGRALKLPRGFEGDAAAEVAQVVSGQTKEVAGAFRDAATEVRRALNAAITAAGPIDDLVDDVAQRLEVGFARAQTAVDAAVMGSGRAAIVSLADKAQGIVGDAGVTIVFRYVGPRDGKVRPFCRAHVGKCYSRAALDAEDNGAGLSPTSTYLGGYNCRHSLAPMTLDDARARGFEVTL